MAIESMVMGDAGVTALVMVGEVCGRWLRGSRSYSYVDLCREGILESVPSRTIIAGNGNCWKAVKPNQVWGTLYKIVSTKTCSQPISHTESTYTKIHSS